MADDFGLDLDSGGCGSCEPNAPRCEGCGCCSECCNCTATDCDCDECKQRRTNEGNMEHVSDADFNLAMPDTHGFLPDPSIVGNVLQHTGNEKQYLIVGFFWMSATDEWGYEHFEMGILNPVRIVRPLSHLAGMRRTNDFRYYEHNEYQHYRII